ncbi:DUF819 family protein [Virgibacillus sp. NKC19-3]|uniref:DUF819 family protein n=1 Tax=Virgibacillus saliphilus TaxID=2831674 RepID=UPI001C9B4287|nr:DUF819 family protein [Virgibacillus sp. NKC19-3]MBY7144083.1 DUF819 family protein [Virgibacillus sp. NKC19-3]
MIQDTFLYISVLIALAAVIVWIEKSTSSKFFKYVPGIVLLYLTAALLRTFGVFGDTEVMSEANSNLRDILLPAMIVLMLINCDLRKLRKLGGKMLLGYATAAISIVVGFTAVYTIFSNWYAPDTWQAFGALSGSWTGGSANMVAIQGILDVPENIFGYALIMDTVNYSVWVMFLFWLVPFASKINKWTGARTDHLDQVQVELEEDNTNNSVGFKEMMVMLAFGLLVSAIGARIGEALPEIGTVINATTWTITIAAVIGLVLATTRFSKMAGSMDIANVMLYIIIALIASNADFSQLFQAPIYIISGFLILFIHLVVMVLLGKVFKLDLFTLGIASLANIGGMASAPMLAGYYNRALIPVGVIMALLGSFLGTYIGLFVSQILSMI